MKLAPNEGILNGYLQMLHIHVLFVVPLAAEGHRRLAAAGV